MKSKTNHQNSSLWVRIGHSIRHQLINGLLVAIPLWLTYVALKFFFGLLDGFFAPLIRRSLGFSIPGLGFVLLLIFLYLIGMVMSNILGRSLFQFWENILDRIPLVKNIYQGAKQLIQTISLSKTFGFKKVVLIEYPRPGLRAIGFVTNTFEDKGNHKRYTVVFIPSPPNPINGLFEIVPENEIIETNLSIEEAIKMVVSAGMLMPAHFASHIEGSQSSS